MGLLTILLVSGVFGTLGDGPGSGALNRLATPSRASTGRFGLTARDSYRANDPAHPAVVLIHGINSGSGSFRHLAPALEAEGFGVLVYDYPFDRDLDESARQFARDWARFREDHDERADWTIVTHSMGSLLARSYVEGESCGSDVSHLFLIGPTNSGAALAKGQPILELVRSSKKQMQKGRGPLPSLGGGLGAAAEDLTPGSTFLRKLNAHPRRADVKYHILAGRSGFVSIEERRAIESRMTAAARAGGILGELARIAVSNALPMLDELSDGTGDGCVSVVSTKLEGVSDHHTMDANHVELIRGPLLYPEPGPIACLPFILERLKPRS